MGEERCKIHVLAVDDDWLIRELLVEFLAHAGCHVRTASNGVEALKILEEVRGAPGATRPCHSPAAAIR